MSEAPPIVSGVSRTVDRLRRDLATQGILADVISANEMRRWSFGEARISSFAWHWPRLSRRFGDYDVINLHGPAPTMSDLFLAAYRATPMRSRPPLVYTHHSAVDLAGLGPLCRLYDSVTARLAAFADRIIVTSESYAIAIATPNGPAVDVIPWGVDAAQFEAPGRSPRRPGDPLRVLFLGQLRPYKGVEVLLESVRDVDGLELTIAGGGPLEGSLTSAASTAANVMMLGCQAEDDLPALFARHDVIALPSTTRAEAFGLVLLEGMAAGCVPVASDLPGVRDVAGPTGVVVPVGDVAALRVALVALANDPDRLHSLSTASVERARVRSWERTASRYAETIREAVVDGHRQRTRHLLPRMLRQPEQAMGAIARRFGATWWSLIVFPGADAAQPVAWGRAAEPASAGQPSRIAAYVAREGRPMLLGPGGDAGAGELMTRRDVASALAIPVRISGSGMGVLTLSVGSADARRYTHADRDRLAELVA
ncbi:MAG TPA: glycosyltransferase family 4 protein [Candidatus Limnocylindrales bacterium]